MTKTNSLGQGIAESPFKACSGCANTRIFLCCPNHTKGLGTPQRMSHYTWTEWRGWFLDMRTALRPRNRLAWTTTKVKSKAAPQLATCSLLRWWTRVVECFSLVVCVCIWTRLYHKCKKKHSRVGLVTIPVYAYLYCHIKVVWPACRVSGPKLA